MKNILVIVAFTIVSLISFGQSDNCATATVINLDASGDACVLGTTVGATSANIGYGACNPLPDVNNEVWYTYVSNGSSNTYTLDPQGMTNPEIVVYTGGCAGLLETCNNSIGTGILTTNWGVPAGTQVWIGVMSNQGTEGAFEFCVSSTVPAPGGGNTCGGALPLCDVNANVTVDMSTITPSGDWPECFGGASNSDVWFTFTCVQSGTLEFEVVPSGTGAGGVELDWALYNNTALGGCPNAAGSGSDPSMSCNYFYDGGIGSPAGMTNPAGGEYNAPVNLTVGETYTIVVDYFSGGGIGFMDFSFLPGMTALIAPEVDFNISPTTITCAPSVDVTITDNSVGIADWDFGNGNTFTGNNPPVQTYLASGTYAITASIGGACPSTATEFVQVFGPLVSVPTFNDETCIGDCDGDASVTITGGSGTYNYFWTPNGETTADISGLCSGPFSVTVSDAICGTSVTEDYIIGGTNCATCLLTNMTSITSACDPATDTYITSGIVEFSDPPLTGTLTVSDCNGNQQVFTAPFISPINYNLTGQTADGLACDITAVFSDDVTCAQTLNATAPICLCNMDNFFASIGSCDGVLNTFQIAGDMEFTSAPATGTLIVEVDNGTAVYDTIISPPFTSPQTYSISGIPADGSVISVTVYFSDDPACAATLNSNAPADCSCTAEVGTFTTSSNVICFGDQVEITSNLDGSPPAEAINPPGPTYDPGIIYLAYTCPPSVFPPNDLWDVNGDPVDPCLIGVVSFGNDYSDPNSNGAPPNYGVPYTDNTIYYVPITGYSLVDGFYSYTNTNVACYDMGSPISVQYLPEVIGLPTEDCFAGTVNVLVSGGLPAVDGSLFTGSNLVPSTASFTNVTAAVGGSILVSGLLDGDNYSFDITDANGCPITISGTFTGIPIADAGADATSCTLSYVLNPTVSFGTGTWTGAGVTFSNANSPTSIATVPSAGSYTMTWTEDNGGGCADTDDVIVQFSNLSYVDAVVQSTCGSADGEITLTASDGVVAYQYSIDNGASFQASGNFTGLLAGNYNVVVQDDIGCQVTGIVSVTDQGGPIINSVTGIDPLCNAGCDGSISIDAIDATQFSIDNGVTFQGVNAFANLCPGNYDIVVTNAVGCQATSSVILNDPAVLSYSAALTDVLCSGQCTGEIDVTVSGGTGTLQYSNDNGVTFGLNNVFTNLCVGNYDIIVEDANGCQTVANEPITEPAPLTVTLGITDPICNSSCDGMINSIPAGGDGNYTYVWSSGQSIPLVANLCTGQYDLNVTDGNGCFIDTTVTLVGPAAAVITNVVEVDESCPGTCDGSLEVVASNVTQYSIDGVNFVAGSIFSNLCSGSYTVYAQDVNGCSTTAPAEVSSPTVVGVSVTATSPICIGGSSFMDGTTTGGTQPFTYAWSDNAGGVVFTTEDGNVSPVLDEVYTFTATDANGCSATTNVLVQVNDPLSLSVFGDTPICDGSPSSLSALASGGDGGPYTYTWDQGLGIGQNQTVFPAQTTVYTVTVTDGCETPPISAQVTVTVNTVPAISFTGDQLSGCLPVTTNFSDNLVPAGSSCLWNFGDGGTSTQCGNPSYVFTQPGCWDVTLTVTTAEGCVETVTIPNYVCVFDYPSADFIFGPQPATVLSPTIDFVNLSSNADLYNWTFDVGGLEDESTLENPEYTFPSANPGTYEVCLEANTLEGCADVLCQNVAIDEEFIIYAPNAFTPGGGDLLNNEFKPIVKGEDPLKYSFMVFNRWGELIFETSYSSEGWDGTYKGLMSQQDVYVWKVTCTDASSKEPHEYIGPVTLLK